jgi:glycosyltransferase involved in cell wall biosynthesis
VRGAGPHHILVVNWLDRENPLAGGAETHLHEVFGRLAGRGHEVTALVSGWAGCAPRATLDGLDVHRAGRRYTFSLAAPRYWRRHLAPRGFDVVVEDLNKVPLFTPYWTNAPVVLLVHHLFGRTAFQAGPAPVAAATWLLERPIPLLYAGRPTIAVSESTRADLVRRGLRADDVRVVPNGIDLEYFCPAPGPRASRPTLLVVGRLKKYKRVDLVVDAVSRLIAEGRDLELLIAGEGDQRSALEAQIARLALGDRVKLLGFVSEAEKRDALRAAWIHVLTSPKEGWGISNLEAAACGTPSIASDSPGLRESVVHGETGLLVPYGDRAALEGAIRTLIDGGALRERMGRRARGFAERFSWDASADGVEAVLRQVVAEGGRH